MRVEFFNFGLKFGNLVIELARAVRNRVGVFSKPCHEASQRRKRTRTKAADNRVATTTKGQVSARPIRQSCPKEYSPGSGSSVELAFFRLFKFSSGASESRG